MGEREDATVTADFLRRSAIWSDQAARECDKELPGVTSRVTSYLPLLELG